MFFRVQIKSDFRRIKSAYIRGGTPLLAFIIFLVLIYLDCDITHMPRNSAF